MYLIKVAFTQTQTSFFFFENEAILNFWKKSIHTETPETTENDAVPMPCQVWHCEFTSRGKGRNPGAQNAKAVAYVVNVCGTKEKQKDCVDQWTGAQERIPLRIQVTGYKLCLWLLKLQISEHFHASIL